MSDDALPPCAVRSYIHLILFHKCVIDRRNTGDYLYLCRICISKHSVCDVHGKLFLPMNTDVRESKRNLTHCALGDMDAILETKFSIVLTILIFRSYDANTLR